MVQPQRSGRTFSYDHASVASELDPLICRFRDPASDPVIRQLMILAPPQLFEDRAINALFAAVGEHLALEAGILVPKWVHDVERSGPDMPVAVPLISQHFGEDTPFSFRKRNLYLV